MSNPNTDPHTFEASTSVAQEVASAQLVVQNGVGYDTFMQQLESSTPSSSRRVIDVQKLLGLSLKTKNPHLWYNPTTMPKVATVDRTRSVAPFAPTRGLLRATTPRVPDVARSRYVSDRDISGADSLARRSRRPSRSRTTSVALGLHNVTPFRFQADIMNGVDPSPEDIAFQENLFTSHRAKVFCYNEQVRSTVTVAMRSLASRHTFPSSRSMKPCRLPGLTIKPGCWPRSRVD